MDCPNKPCEDLEEFKKDVDARFREHEKMLNKSEVNFAVICTKLNWVLGILAALGAGLIPIAYNTIFR